MQKFILFFSISFLSSIVHCQIFGQVNGEYCLEPKDSNGCCQVKQTENGHSINECPWSTPTYVCKKEGQCLSGITASCEAGYGEVFKYSRDNTLDTGCRQPYWTTFTEERKKGIRKMNEWCTLQGGKLITIKNYLCECQTEKFAGNTYINYVCRNYKKFEDKK